MSGIYLITGGTGFLGAHLVCHLIRDGHRVRILHRASSSRDELQLICHYYFQKNIESFQSQIEWMEGDILDIHSLDLATQGVEKVIHAAAVVSFHKKDREIMHKINAEGTSNLVNACLLNGVKKLVHISSTSALASFNKNEPVDESCDYHPEEENSAYGKSKHKAEMEVWRGMEEGLNAVIINPSVILGYGNWDKGSCKLFKQYAHNFPFFSIGSNAFVGVEDVCQCTLLLLESDIHSERFLCVSENLPFQKVFFAMADGFDRKKPGIKITPWKATFAWRLFAIGRFFGVKTLISKESAKASVSHTAYSNQKIGETLNYSFTPIAEVIHRACEAYRENYLTNKKG